VITFGDAFVRSSDFVKGFYTTQRTYHTSRDISAICALVIVAWDKANEVN